MRGMASRDDILLDQQSDVVAFWVWCFLPIFRPESHKLDTEPVLDKVIWSQLATSTHQPGFHLNVKNCVYVYIILVIFVLFLLVMCIWVDLQVLEIWDFGSTLKYRQAKLSQASSVGSPPGPPQSTWMKEDVE
jgi:hypothetical protein